MRFPKVKVEWVFLGFSVLAFLFWLFLLIASFPQPLTETEKFAYDLYDLLSLHGTIYSALPIVSFLVLSAKIFSAYDTLISWKKATLCFSFTACFLYQLVVWLSFHRPPATSFLIVNVILYCLPILFLGALVCLSVTIVKRFALAKTPTK